MLVCIVWLGCSSGPTVRHAGSVAHNDLIYLIVGGWHTELAIGSQLISGPLATLKSGFPNAKYFVFGWGARDYYMAQNPGIKELLQAVAPGPAVMLVIPLEVSPEIFAGAVETFILPISQDGAQRLSEFLWNDLGKDQEGTPRRIGPGPFPQSTFYASSKTYDFTHTCNTWTAAALRVAGLPVSEAGVIFSGQVLDQVRPLAEVMPQPVQNRR